jgi:hypothetical protein
MKKFLILTTASYLFLGIAFAGNIGDKGKDKGKKAPKTTKTCTKSCPGKECSKKKRA